MFVESINQILEENNPTADSVVTDAYKIYSRSTSSKLIYMNYYY